MLIDSTQIDVEQPADRLLEMRRPATSSTDGDRRGESKSPCRTEPFFSSLNGRDLEGMLSLFSPEFIFDDYALQVHLTEHNALRDFVKRLMSAFPDASQTITS